MSNPWDYDRFEDLEDSDGEATTLELLRRYKSAGNAFFAKKEFQKAVRSVSNTHTHNTHGHSFRETKRRLIRTEMEWNVRMTQLLRKRMISSVQTSNVFDVSFTPIELCVT
ncbi:hypothetical protein OAV88_00955 [bacterium]|nr:hypothetical protein [bacterium]